MRVKARPDFKERTRDDSSHETISPDEIYLVIAVDRDFYRVIDDAGQPVMFPKELFEVIDKRIPSGWAFDEHVGGSYYLEPIPCSVPGFYEDYYGSDGDQVAQIRSHSIVTQVIAAMRDELDGPAHGTASLALERQIAATRPRHVSLRND
jgi:hypothetical protein